MVGRSIPPKARTLSGSPLACRVNSAERRTTRITPVSPTNMWWASSVSMKRVVRLSGSKALSARASN